MMYPWQSEQWQQLWQAKQENRLPHALLVTGIPGLGKSEFVYHFVRALLCQQVGLDGIECGNCHACRLIAGKTHPNVLWVEPEEPGQAIKVDQIRLVNEFASQSSLQGDYRFVIINPADDMNTNAANALLKTLEEPSSGAIIVLVSHQSKCLPATVLSRCQQIVFSHPNKEQALQWLRAQPNGPDVNLELMLNLANGAPLTALRLMQDEVLDVRQELFAILYSLSQKQGDPIKSAAKLQDNDPLKLIDFSLSWVMDLVRLQLGEDGTNIVNTDHTAQLTELASSTQLKINVKYMEYLLGLRMQIARGLNLNKQLLVESMLLRV